LVQLYGLILTDNHINGSIPPQLTDLTLLRLIQLYANDLCGCFPASWRDVTYGLNQCDVRGIPNNCDCTMPDSCNHTTCTPGFRCPGDPPPPQPMPVPVSIPAPGPLSPSSPAGAPSSPVLSPTASPVILPAACDNSSGYTLLFDCLNGEWVTNSLTVSSDLDLSNAIFRVYANADVNGGMLSITNNAQFYVKNLLIEKEGSLYIDGSGTESITANLTSVNAPITILVPNNFKPITVGKCINIGGPLNLNLFTTPNNPIVLIFDYGCSSKALSPIITPPTCGTPNPLTSSGTYSIDYSGTACFAVAPSSTTPSAPASNNTGAIVGGIIGGVVVLLLIILLILFITKRELFGSNKPSGVATKDPEPTAEPEYQEMPKT